MLIAEGRRALILAVSAVTTASRGTRSGARAATPPPAPDPPPLRSVHRHAYPLRCKSRTSKQSRNLASRPEWRSPMSPRDASNPCVHIRVLG
jgi:hypothetical protein